MIAIDFVVYIVKAVIPRAQGGGPFFDKVPNRVYNEDSFRYNAAYPSSLMCGWLRFFF